MADTTNKTDMMQGRDHVEDVEAVTAPPTEDSKITWRDFWENKRVLGFCKCLRNGSPAQGGKRKAAPGANGFFIQAC